MHVHNMISIKGDDEFLNKSDVAMTYNHLNNHKYSFNKETQPHKTNQVTKYIS